MSCVSQSLSNVFHIESIRNGIVTLHPTPTPPAETPINNPAVVATGAESAGGSNWG